MSNDKVQATFHGTDTVAVSHGMPRPSDNQAGWVFLKNLGEEIYDTAYSKGWYDEQRTVGDRIALIHSELSEALEEHRNGHGLTEVYYTHTDQCNAQHEQCMCLGGPKPEGIPIELADAMIRIMDFAAAENMDLPGAIEEKMKFNRDRSHRHGGKTL